jgi:MtN3 and saliva related transmembrane protein
MHDATNMLHNAELVGFVAGFGTTFAAVPDLVRMLKHRSSRGMSPVMPALMAVFQVIWMYYGVLIESRPVVWWNIVAVAVNSMSVIAFALFSRRDRDPALK